MEEIDNYLNVFVAGRIVGPDRCLHLVPRTLEYATPQGKMDFARCDWVRDLEILDCLVSLSVITQSLRCERGRQKS